MSNNAKPFTILNDGYPKWVEHDYCAVIDAGHCFKKEHIPQWAIDGCDAGPGKTVIQCAYCGVEGQLVDSPTGVTAKAIMSDYHSRSQNYETREPLFTPCEDKADLPPVTKKDLVICFILLVVATLAATAHYFFGG